MTATAATPPLEPSVASDRAQAHVVAGNRLTVLEDGPEQRDTLVRLIDSARTSLRLLYYIYADDESGRLVRDRLRAAVDRGVTVRLIVDGFGSGVPSDFFDDLRSAGAGICRFHPRLGRRYLLRNHQKMALADDGRAIVGGFNIEDDYFATVAQGGWRDLGLLLEGPAAHSLGRYFDSLFAWTQTGQARVRHLRKRLREFSAQDGPVSWLFGGPTRRLSPWAQAVKREIQGSRRFWMIAAYFAPGPFMLRRIERAGQRGDARVLTAAKSDNGATIGAARFLYRGLLKKKVRVFEYQPTKLHTKLFVIDDVVHIGSANFDMRSLYLNLELMLRVKDKAFADQMRRYFEHEQADSREIALAEISGWRSWPTRIRWGAAYFLVAMVDYTVTRRLNFGLDGSEL